jgi:hypothetical protein
MRYGSLAVLGAAFLALWGAVPSQGQTSWPRITSVVPSGAQRGTVVEITVSGINVGAATGILFEGTGLSVESITPEPSPPPPTPPAAGARPVDPPKNRTGKVVATVRIAADAEPGLRAMRVLTPLGPSDIAFFVVGQWPEVEEQEPNNTRAQAQSVTFPSTVAGRTSPGEDVDVFRFQAREGQTLVFDVFATRMESPLDSILMIQDANGRELALNEDSNGADSLLAFSAPRTDEYFLVLRDLRHQGSTNHVYRLTLGEIPYVTAVFPAGGRPGETVELELKGYNLGDRRTTRVTIPGDAPPGPRPMTLPLGERASNPVTLTMGEIPEAVETEPNDDPAQAQLLTTPGMVFGRILAPGTEANARAGGPMAPKDVDHFRFRAAKQQRLILEVMARRSGSSLDSMLVVTDAKGKEIAVNDDGAGKDSRVDFTAPEEGEYIARISDLHGRHGPNFGYRFSIGFPTPDFSLTFTPDRLTVGPGGRIPITVTAQRTNFFDGEIAIEVKDLPKGVSVVGPARIRAGQRETTIVLSAATDAVPQTTAFRVIGTATVDGKSFQRGAQGNEEVVRNNQKVARPVNLLTAAVAAPPELLITAPAEKVTVAPGKSVEIAVTVERKEGFKGKVPLTVVGLPNNTITFTAPDIPADKTEGKVTIQATDRAGTIETEIVIAAREVIDNQRHVLHASVPLVLAVARPAAPPAASK